MTKFQEQNDMLDQLCVYLDDLATKEKENNWYPLQLRRELIEVHNLFSGVSDISFDDLKKLYFKRKSISQVNKQDLRIIQKVKVKDLKPGDRIKLGYKDKILTIESVTQCPYLIVRYKEDKGYYYNHPDQEWELVVD